jgi:hypothetical protein
MSLFTSVQATNHIDCGAMFSLSIHNSASIFIYFWIRHYMKLGGSCTHRWSMRRRNSSATRGGTTVRRIHTPIVALTAHDDTWREEELQKAVDAGWVGSSPDKAEEDSGSRSQIVEANITDVRTVRSGVV